MKNDILNLIDKAINNEDFLFEMANLRTKYTGFTNNKLVVYVSNKQGSHGPRVKIYEPPRVSEKYPCVIFSISKEPEILENHNLVLSTSDIREIKYWISINHVLLLKLWNTNVVYIDDFLDNFTKI